MTADELRACIESHHKNQSQIAGDLGISTSGISKWANGSRKIDERDAKLLRLYFYGEIPFGLIRPDIDLQTTLRFTHTEWQIITIIAHRQGFLSAQSWITAQIRAYLQHNSQAEDISPVYQGKKIPPSKVAEKTLKDKIEELKALPSSPPRTGDGNGKEPPK